MPVLYKAAPSSFGISTPRARPAAGKRVVRLLFLFYWLLVVEGALRKWGLPQLEQVLFFIRDQGDSALELSCCIEVVTLAGSVTIVFQCLTPNSVILPEDVNLLSFLGTMKIDAIPLNIIAMT